MSQFGALNHSNLMNLTIAASNSSSSCSFSELLSSVTFHNCAIFWCCVISPEDASPLYLYRL